MSNFPIQVPNPEKFVPRDYQLPFWSALNPTGVRRAMLVWHRRAGKDWVVLNKIAEMLLVWFWDTPCTAIYLAGKSQRHGAAIVWDNKTNDGLSYLDAFPEELIAHRDDRNYTLTFKNGSIFKVVTTLDKEAARGANPKIVAFSEYDYIDNGPYIWTSVILPILLMNDGIALFTTTPDGVKQTYRLYTSNHDNPEWFMEIRDCEHTLHNGQRVLTDAMVEQGRREGMSDAKINQEFYCDFFAESEGTFYEKEFRAIRAEGRIREVPYDPALPVHTFWDLGIDDPMAIWFAQVDYLGNWRWIDYFQSSDKSIMQGIKEVHSKPYTYGVHVAPHDLKQRDLFTGQTRLEMALRFGFRFTVAPKMAFKDGIDAARSLLTRSYFDGSRTAQGTECLKHYEKKESTMVDQFGNVTYTGDAVHNWASHGSDAFRMAAIMRDYIQQNNAIFSSVTSDVNKLPLHAKCDYDILDT
jgi:phage terminase large subunit